MACLADALVVGAVSAHTWWSKRLVGWVNCMRGHVVDFSLVHVVGVNVARLIVM